MYEQPQPAPMLGLEELLQDYERLKQENAALRRASEAAAAHRTALEQLASDCLAHMAMDAEDMVNIIGRMSERGPLTRDDYHVIIDDCWHETYCQLERRFFELSTQEEVH